MLQKRKVGYGFRVIKLQSVGVEAYKTHISGCKCKVFIAENSVEYLLACSQTVVISQQAYIGDAQAVQNIALFFKFHFHAEVGKVAAMYHEIHIITFVDSIYGIFRFIIPALCVADKDKRKLFLSVQVCFNGLYVFPVNVCISLYIQVVGMIFYHVAPVCQHRKTSKCQCGKCGV